MKPAPFRYHRPATLAEALDLYAALEDARLLAGGQSLMPMLNLRLARFDHVIDLGAIPELQGIEVAEHDRGGRVRVGAMTPQADLKAHAALAAACPVLPAALAHVGHLQTRNRGTLGGSLCHMDPSAELPGLMLLHDAKLTIAGGGADQGTARRIDMADLAAGYLETSLCDGEILTIVEFDLWPAGHGWGFHEFAQRRGDFAIAGAAALMTVDEDGRIARTALALIGVGEGPVRATAAEEMLAGAAPTPDAFARAAATLTDLDVLADHMVSAAYRRHLAQVMLRRALADAAARAGARLPDPAREPAHA